MDVTADWFWEGNVVEAIARFLADEGWTIVGKADTHSKERGVDIQATRSGRTLLVEAKGYPAKTYRDPRRAGEIKPTNPTNQAQQWYSHALLKVMRLQNKHPALSSRSASRIFRATARFSKRRAADSPGSAWQC